MSASTSQPSPRHQNPKPKSVKRSVKSPGHLSCPLRHEALASTLGDDNMDLPRFSGEALAHLPACFRIGPK
jgi:hypothetical protein